MISYEFGQLVSKAYVSKEEFHSENNYFVNPLYTPENVLKKYPPSHMYIGDNDPLHDDAVRYAYRMK
jgi:acetyl esterase/lipase